MADPIPDGERDAVRRLSKHSNNRRFASPNGGIGAVEGRTVPDQGLGGIEWSPIPPGGES